MTLPCYWPPLTTVFSVGARHGVPGAYAWREVATVSSRARPPASGFGRATRDLSSMFRPATRSHEERFLAALGMTPPCYCVDRDEGDPWLPLERRLAIVTTADVCWSELRRAGAMPMLSGGSVSEAELRFATYSHRHNSGPTAVFSAFSQRADRETQSRRLQHTTSFTTSSARRIGISPRQYKSV